VTRVLWAPQVIQDVEAIRTHVARDSPHHADLVVERIVAAETTGSSTACDMRSSRVRASFMLLACCESTDNDDIQGRTDR
jgi:plasmid stabilization system protein ParE